ncbi:MAG: response regulator [bacterium]|nr:response regulator [bacterium]
MKGGQVRLAGSHALDVGSTPITRFAVGEGIIGQAAQDGKFVVLDEVPTGHLAVKPGFGERASHQVLIWPICRGDDVKAVMNLGASGAFEPCKFKFQEKVMENLWVALGVAQSMELQAELLEESQAQSEELAAGEEELIDSNRSLAQETEKLRASESFVQEKRNELQRANRRLEDQAESLSLASKYKSEFLANMSHELRTPLNSLLILSGSLAGNDEGNLTEDQVEALQAIHGGGKDLLTLVNDILDLSKIEAGKMGVSVGSMELDAMVHGLQGQFRPVAADKGVKLDFELSDLLPRAIQSDSQKVAQVLRNLLSNAIKFTAQGQVRLSISRAAADVEFAREDLIAADTILFAVSDTGIGIPEDKLEAVFESFQQADGSTSRKYGGTGLGLSISRQFAELLGGELQVNSCLGEGSTFTLCLPVAAVETHDDGVPEHSPVEAPNPTAVAPLGFPAQAPVLDDRRTAMPGDRSVLIIQQDAQLATTLQGLCRGRGFQTFVAGSGAEGMKLAFEFQPGTVLLDLDLDDVDGLQVLGELLHECVSPKHAVQVISDQDQEDVVLAMGAKGFICRAFTDGGIQQMLNGLDEYHRPVSKRLLVIEENPSIRELVMEAIDATDVDVVEAVDGAQGLTLLATGDFDGLILTLENDAVEAIEFLGKLENSAIDAPSVFVQAGSGLASSESRGLQDHGCNVVIEDLPKLDLLLEKVNLFMGGVDQNFFDSKGTRSPSKRQPSDELRGKHVLLVDDDMRNTFALSRVLKAKGLRVTLAGDGQQALDVLKAKTDISLVIMDMMMPVMDGFEAIRQIRQTPRIAELSVLAVTARALHEDRIKCIEVGATDYLAKPIDVDKLLSRIHVWVADV